LVQKLLEVKMHACMVVMIASFSFKIRKGDQEEQANAPLGLALKRCVLFMHDAYVL
jgi:hypothetical protein